MTDLNDALKISASGMKAQGARLRVIAENLANADSVAKTPGGDPYRRKVITFRNVLDRELGVDLVEPSRVTVDRGPLETRYDPNNPAADEKGYVKVPNVNTLIELADMREAERSYEANLKVIEASRTMLQRAIDILR
jgi:flagellar basal-body rod protein FlgC